MSLMYKHFFKRLIDIVLSGFGIVVLALPMLVIALAIKLDSKGPVLFKQKRVGLHKKHFNIYKFRTMRTDTPKDAPTHELSDPKKWITKVGGFLRKTSLDELPQMFNIFEGTMSIIGPRPALWNQYDLIEERDKYGANDVPVGLTGWAQINGRDELEIPVKAALDGEYVKRQSFLFDCKCFFGTFVSVLKSDGVVEGGTGEIHKHEADKNAQSGNKLGLSEKSMETLLGILATANGVASAKVFGSRAKGCAKKGSDIDLCLFVTDGFTVKDKLGLVRKFEESSLPYQVDVLVYGELQNESLKEHIDQVGVTVYE